MRNRACSGKFCLQHAFGVVAQLGQAELVVALRHDVERFFGRRRAAGSPCTACLRPVGRGDVGAAAEVVARDVHLVGRERVDDVVHAQRARRRRTPTAGSARPAGGTTGRSRATACWSRSDRSWPARVPRKPEVVVEVDQALQVERVVERRAGRVQLDEAVERRQRLRLLAAFQRHVGALDLGLLGEQRAGGAAFEPLVSLIALLVVAERGFFLGFGIESLRRSSARCRPWCVSQPASSSARRSEIADTASRRRRSVRCMSHAGVACGTRRWPKVESIIWSTAPPPTRRRCRRRRWRAREARPVETRDATVAAALHGERLDKALVALAPEFSRSHLQGLIEGGWCGSTARPATSASRNACAPASASRSTLQPTAESRAFRAEPWRCASSTRTTQLLVIDKPAGLVVASGGRATGQGTLLNGLLARDPASARRCRAPASCTGSTRTPPA